MGHRHPNLEVYFTDVSHWAVESARLNWTLQPWIQSAEFLVGDALEKIKSGSVDLIVCNPPFHDGHATGDRIAWRMFNQARKALKPGGELRIVGNRHLGYHAKLKRIFGNCKTIAK